MHILLYAGYSSDEMSEYEYMDPYEEEGPISTTPPPACKGKEHEICIPPAWGEKIPGAVVRCRCLLCHQENRDHALRCVQCQNAPGCCVCICGYMRSQYNSGCPLCRAGDPQCQDPLAPNQARVIPVRRDQLTRVVYNSRCSRGRRGVRGGLVCGIGRARGRGRPAQEEEEQIPPQEQSASSANTARRSRRICLRRPGRGRSRTIESVEEDRKKEELKKKEEEK